MRSEDLGRDRDRQMGQRKGGREQNEGTLRINRGVGGEAVECQVGSFIEQHTPVTPGGDADDDS